MNQHVLTADLEHAVETDLSTIRRPRREALADLHRRELAKGKQLIAQHKRDLKATISAIREDRKAAKAAYEAELDRLAENLSEERRQELKDRFRRSSYYEWNFWQQAWTMETWELPDSIKAGV